VFGPQDKYPYLPDASYISPEATTCDYVNMLSSIGCSRAVLVQPSVYGTDNRCMLDAMASGLFDFRGVAVVEPSIGDAELQAMHRTGVRGIRINVASETSGLALVDAPALAARIKHMGWHLQFFVNLDRTPGFHDCIARLPVPCVIDHFGHFPVTNDLASEGAQALLKLAQLDHAWFKLGGGYRVSRQPAPFPEVAPLARALVAAAPTRCVWGSDWPHPAVERMPYDADLIDALALWVPDAALRDQVLADNPARLYGF
jgi:predicted TIM-barrel fold metal-dependent hydrolase